MTRRIYRLAVVCLGALTACTSPSADWSNASKANTIAEYGEFIHRHPHDAHAKTARLYIARLQDQADWNQAQVASSVAGYMAYLKAEPNGSYVQTARDNIVARQCDAAWFRLQSGIRPSALQEFLRQCPAGARADQARVDLRQMTGYRAALAEEHSEGAANRVRTRLIRRLKGTLSDIVVLAPDRGNPDYRVTSAPMSEREVNSLCDRVASNGQACWIVPASDDSRSDSTS